MGTVQRGPLYSRSKRARLAGHTLNRALSRPRVPAGTISRRVRHRGPWHACGYGGPFMRFDDLYIAGCGTWLPRPMTLDEAEQAGLCDRRLIWRTGIVSVCVATDKSAPELAALAAGRAISQAGFPLADIDLVLHATTYYQGHDMWSPASYVQRTVRGNRCPTIEIRAMSNGGMAAMELAASYLTAAPARRHALITTGDRFCLPGFDRWRSDPGTICGDGGTA